MEPVEDKFLFEIKPIINEYLEDIAQALQKGSIEEETIFSYVEELKKTIDKKVMQSIKDIKEEREKDLSHEPKERKQTINNSRIHEISGDIKVASIEEIEKRRAQARKEQQLQKEQTINNPRIHETLGDIKVASIEEIEKRRTQAKKEQQLQEDQMWQQRDEGIDNAKRQEKRMLENMDYERRIAEIEENKRQEKQRREAEKIKSDAEKDLAKCHEIFGKVENGYKDLVADDSFYLDMKENLIQNYTAEELEKALVGKPFTVVYEDLEKKFNIISQKDKEKQIERHKNIRERTELLQKQPYRVISSEIQLSIYFDMIESHYEGLLPKAYLREKQDMLKNYSEENTYIMPQDMLSYFEKILNGFGYGEQSPKEYDQEAKELKTAIEQIKQRKELEKMQNIKPKSEESKVEAKEPIKKESHLQKRNIFKNIYESAKAKVTSIFKKNKVRCFPIEDDKNKSNKFKESIGDGVLTQKEQAQNARQYQEEQKYKTTNDRVLDNINSTINNNYNIR